MTVSNTCSLGKARTRACSHSLERGLSTRVHNPLQKQAYDNTEFLGGRPKYYKEEKRRLK